mmetsp:Transcript_10723/g.28164  ORF Transcript_10723/g.28164 Transcript_10723/m.28164 type:complete len:319 (+) Transcript_10723:176-1132(+)
MAEGVINLTADSRGSPKPKRRRRNEVIDLDTDAPIDLDAPGAQHFGPPRPPLERVRSRAAGWFDGTRVFLTQLSPSPLAMHGKEIHLEDAVLAHLMQDGLIISFGTDYRYLTEDLLEGQQFEPGQITVVDSDRDFSLGRVQIGTKEQPFTVVNPPHWYSIRSMAEVQRTEKGSMHAKLMIWLLGGAGEPRWLRVVISSANLGAYDSLNNNVIWVQDFRVRALDHANAAPTEFACDLLAFVRQLLTLPETEKWAAHALGIFHKGENIFAEFDFAVPDGLKLVASVPGWHRLPGQAQLSSYGYARMRECLSEANVPKAER